MRDGFETAVLRVAAAIPEGRVLSYSDIADLLDGRGPRAVGRVMSHHGDEVAWWRVLRADGTVFPPLAVRAAAAYEREGTPLMPVHGGAGRAAPRVRMRQARWQPTPEELAQLDRALAADGWPDADTPEGPPRVLSVADDQIEA